MTTARPSPDGDRAAGLLASVAALVPRMQSRAALLDEAASFPADDMDDLRAVGLLAAPLPVRLGGLGAGTEPEGAMLAVSLLRLLGRGNLAVARLFEAHLNALRLVVRFGAASQVTTHAADALAGHLFGLWVTDPPGAAPLREAAGRLVGRKGPCSGAGHCTRALVTAERGTDTCMAVVALSGDETVHPVEKLHGMRAAANGTVVLDGLPVPDESWVGDPGDYLREPDFSCGAWRGSAAASGGLDALVDVVRRDLLATGRGHAPLQLARFGALLIAQEGARLWVERAASAAELPGEAGAQVAAVNLARLAVEAACMEAMNLAQRSLGLRAFGGGHALERLGRDVATYLRQPAPDAVLLEAAAWHLERPAP